MFKKYWTRRKIKYSILLTLWSAVQTPLFHYCEAFSSWIMTHFINKIKITLSFSFCLLMITFYFQNNRLKQWHSSSTDWPEVKTSRCTKPQIKAKVYNAMHMEKRLVERVSFHKSCTEFTYEWYKKSVKRQSIDHWGQRVYFRTLHHFYSVQYIGKE